MSSYYTTQIRGVPRRTEVSELLSLRVSYSVISSYSTRIQTLRSLTHVYTLSMYSFAFITHQRGSIIELDRQSAKRSKVARRKSFTRKGSNLRVSVYYKLAAAVLRDEREKERKNGASVVSFVAMGPLGRYPRASYEIYKQREAGALQTIYDDTGACR